MHYFYGIRGCEVAHTICLLGYYSLLLLLLWRYPCSACRLRCDEYFPRGQILRNALTILNTIQTTKDKATLDGSFKICYSLSELCD